MTVGTLDIAKNLGNPGYSNKKKGLQVNQETPLTTNHVYVVCATLYAIDRHSLTHSLLLEPSLNLSTV